MVVKDPSLLNEKARSYADLPGGHSEGYDDTFKQVFRRFYRTVADRSAAGRVSDIRGRSPPTAHSRCGARKLPRPTPGCVRLSKVSSEVFRHRVFRAQSAAAGAPVSICSSSIFCTSPLPVAPTFVATSWPPLNSSSVGIPRT